MSAKKRAAKIAISDAHREHAEAYLHGDYPAWRMNLQEWSWARRLRKAEEVRAAQETEPAAQRRYIVVDGERFYTGEPSSHEI